MTYLSAANASPVSPAKSTGFPRLGSVSLPATARKMTAYPVIAQLSDRVRMHQLQRQSPMDRPGSAWRPVARPIVLPHPRSSDP